MNIIRNIIADYEKLIKTNIQIPLSNGDTIKFAFNPQDLPHLLGLQYLVDNPILFEYKEKRLSATDLYNRMCSDGEDAIDIDEFENSEHFDEIYEKLGYIDIQNLAKRMKAELLMFTGLMDTTCPPSTQFAMYNKVTSKKSYITYPEFGHELPSSGYDVVFEFLADL